MNITQILNTLDIGGLERMVVDLSIGLQRRGHRVRVVCLRHSGPLQQPLEEAGVAVTALNKPEDFHLPTLGRLIRLLRADRAQAVHTHNPLVQIYGALGGRLAGVGAVVATRHGLGNYPLITKTEAIFRHTARLMDRVVAVCQTAADYFHRHNRIPLRKLVVIYNGIPLEKFLAVGPAPGGERFVFGTVGRLVPVKDHRSLIEAFALARRENPRIGLEILGDGQLRGELEEFARAQGVASEVLFHGATLDVPSFLNRVDAFVLSSVSEGLPLTILEAMAAGRPILGTAVGGIPELLADADCGWVTPPGSPAEMASQLLRLAAEPERRAMGERGRQRASALYSLEQMTAAYEALYEEILRGKRGGK